MNYFITGGAGFIGSNLVDRLMQAKNRVTVYDNLSGGSKEVIKHHFKNSNFKFIKGDILDKKLLDKSIKGHDFVFHLASNPDIAKSAIYPDLDLKQGIMTTFNVLDAMRISGIKKIFYTSGSGVYGDQGTMFTSESFGPLLPVSMYGASKLGSEGLVSAFCHMYDMQAWVFRPANIVGRRQTHGVGYDFIKKLKQNPSELTILGDGRQSKCYIYIDDVLDAFLLAVKKAKERVNIFNLASNTFIDVTSIAKIVANEMGLKGVEFKYTGGSIGWKGDVPKVRLNTRRLNKLGYRPKFNAKEAVRKSIRDLLDAK